MATKISNPASGWGAYFPCITVLANGDFVAGWGESSGSYGKTRLFKSSNQGSTWTDLTAAWMDKGSGYNFQTPEILETANGDIYCFGTFVLNDGSYRCSVVFRKSTDGMQTWSDECLLIGPTVDYEEGAAQKGKPIEMQGGYIGVPVYVRKGYSEGGINNLQFRNVFMRWHPDNGDVLDSANWELYYVEDWGLIGTACDEWHCIETHDAEKLIGFHRSGENAPSNYWKRTSTDQGETWSDKTLLFQNERATPEQARFLNPDTLMLTRTWRLSNDIKVLYSLDEGATFEASETIILDGTYTSSVDLWYLSFDEYAPGDFVFVYGYLGQIYMTFFSVYPDVYANVDGTFQQIKKAFAKHAGQWKPVSMYANNNGFVKIADIPQ